MMNKLDYVAFKRIVNSIIGENNEVESFLFDVYSLSIDSINNLVENGLLNPFFINHVDLVFYILGEYIYSTKLKSKEELEVFMKDENVSSSIASIATDKYITLSMFNVKERRLGNKYLPPVSSLNLYLNFIANILKNYRKNDPRSTLIVDLLNKSISISRCISTLLVEGYETEAFSSWRTLHECECTLVVLASHPNECIPTYLRHMQYAMVFRKGKSDTEEEESIFQELKTKMREKGLKSKEMKKYIEYGWLYSVPNTENDELFKLNFRDGLEKLAGLEQYNERYELSSEIIHSTPMLIYSSKDYYYYATLLSLYESFFRLEGVFVTLFSNSVSKSDMDKYNALKQVYFAQLTNIHKREVLEFKKWQNNLKKK